MPFPLVAAIALIAGLQTPAADRSRALDLARTGQTVEALDLFKRYVETHPGDIDARLWVARLELRLGRTAEAEAGFRSVLREQPADVDAMIGLAIVQTRMGAVQDALALLHRAEPAAGQNADLFGALARAYRRAGDDRRALEYYERARTLAPRDPDVVHGYEAIARSYGHRMVFDGFAQTDDGGIGSGAITFDVRLKPTVRLDASLRKQAGRDYSDATAGGGVFWRATHTTTAALHVLGGSGNTALPGLDIAGDVAEYAGAFVVGVSVRHLRFAGSHLTAVSPQFGWDRDRWRVDARYTYSRSTFEATEETTGDHSGLLRGTWQPWRRVALQAAVAYGIESFEVLTADRLGAFGTTTLAPSIRIDLRSLTRAVVLWEHQWRSNHTSIDRFTLSIVQAIP